MFLIRTSECSCAWNISFSIDPLLFCSFNGTIKSFHHFPPKKKTNNLVRPVVPPIANYFTQNITYNYLELVQIIDIVTLDKIKEILFSYCQVKASFGKNLLFLSFC